MSWIATTNGTILQDQTTLTTAHAAGAGAGIAIAVLHSNIISTGSLPTSIGITCNGVAMTLIGTVQTTNITVSVFYITNPPPGSVNYVASWTNSSRRCMLAVHSYTENAFISASYVYESGEGTSESVSVPTSSGDMAFDAHTHKTQEAVAVGAGQTERTDVYALTTNCHASEELATGTSVTMSNTWVTSAEWAHIAFAMHTSSGQVICWSNG